ncbi:hypothetical protein MASR2M78_01820 [Treponema sp.]
MKLGLNSTSLPDFTISNRILRRTVQSQLESLDLKCTQDLADIIVDLGMQSNLTYLEPWLRTGSADKALQIVRHFISARRMFAVIELAGGKAASVVSALQSYLEPNMEKPDTYKL